MVNEIGKAMDSKENKELRTCIRIFYLGVIKLYILTVGSMVEC